MARTTPTGATAAIPARPHGGTELTSAFRWGATLAVLLATAMPAFAGDAAAPTEGPAIFGIPFEFVLFALTLLGVALFHHHTLQVALTGLASITLYKLTFTGFKFGAGLGGLASHLGHEWVMLANLFCLLMGFALLSRHFEKSHVPAVLPKFLPDDWKGAFVMLVMVFVLSSFLDNIAAALIGGAMAHSLFKAKVHVGYLAAIVAASNAGGSGSVVGDTTTTMMWIDGVNPLDVTHAYAAALPALIFCGVIAAKQQHAYSPILKHVHAHTRVDWARVGIVGFILVAAITANAITNIKFPEFSARFPFIGTAVWLALIASVPLRRPDWEVLPETFKGTVFLLSLVTCASMMPVEKLPIASWQTALGLGFVSAVFDNIPLTALALKQGGYDWGFLAYTVGFGGSMIWFGSSAGVALSNMYPEAKSTLHYLRHGWHVAVAYVIGFIFMYFILGWQPHAPHKVHAPEPVPAVQGKSDCALPRSGVACLRVAG
jgi:Na+/H+ antiporter NhaD/arsenite permease-like protein